eukprot:gene4865-6064_t
MACALGSNNDTKHLKVALIESGPIRPLYPLSEIPDIRTISLSNESIQYLKSIGVWDILENSGRVCPYNQLRVWDTSGFQGIHFENNNNSKDSPMGYIIENNIVTSSLFEKIKSFENITIKSPFQVQSAILNNNNNNVVEQQDENSNNELPSVKLNNGLELNAKLIIGADGGNSVIKKYLSTESVGRNYNQKAVVCTLKLGEGYKCDTLYQRFLSTGPVALLPLSNGYANIIWSTNVLHANYLLSLDDKSFLEQLHNAFLSPSESKNDSIRDLVNGIFNLNPTGFSGNEIYFPPIEKVVSKRASFPLRLDHTPQYVYDRLCLIGDACHVVHPLAGQGVNLGLYDVRSLTSVIAEAVRSGYDIGDKMMLSNFEKSRKLDNMAMLASVDMLYNIFTTTSTPAMAIRNIGMSILNQISPLKVTYYLI